MESVLGGGKSPQIKKTLKIGERVIGTAQGTLTLGSD
jgi:hypothetical protein